MERLSRYIPPTKLSKGGNVDEIGFLEFTRSMLGDYAFLPRIYFPHMQFAFYRGNFSFKSGIDRISIIFLVPDVPNVSSTNPTFSVSICH